ncbi:MAG: agmatinase [Thermoplasmata archaeon]|nr:MAG: agmatinase [Thermoplasmata archaeon]HEC89403.1 agmatinase [Thermoplasmatales archaeon]
MDFPSYFADAETDFREALFVLFGIPYDRTVSFRSGAKEAPDSIREASWNFEAFDILNGLNFKDIPVHDYGNLPINNNDKPEEMVKKTRKFTEYLLKNNKIPIGIGGEHSTTIGIVSAFPKDTVVIVFDAHLDFRDKYQDELYNHACVIRRLSEHIGVENIFIIGVRSADQLEFEEATKKKLRFYDILDVYNRGIEGIIEEIKREIEDRDVYLTIDIDVFDPAYAPGTGTPEPFGLKPFDIIKSIDPINSNIIGLDIVEVCPPFDHGETSILAAKLIRYIIESIWLEKKKKD